jgi:hypothetical protein
MFPARQRGGEDEQRQPGHGTSLESATADRSLLTIPLLSPYAAHTTTADT